MEGLARVPVFGALRLCTCAAIVWMISAGTAVAAHEESIQRKMRGLMAPFAVSLPHFPVATWLQKLPKAIADFATSAAGTESELALAEQQFEENLAHRDAALEKAEVTEGTLRSLLLSPLYPCALEARLGRWADGRSLCLKHRRRLLWSGSTPGVAISIGYHGDASFEKDLVERFHIGVVTLGYSAAAKGSSIWQVSLYPWKFRGLAQKGALPAVMPTGKAEDVADMVTQLGLPHIDLLKLDCGECAYDVAAHLAEAYTRNTVPFGQIQMELHGTDNVPRTVQLIEALEGLGFRIFSSHANTHSRTQQVSWIHESLVQPFLGAPKPKHSGTPQDGLQGRALAAALGEAEGQYQFNRKKHRLARVEASEEGEEASEADAFLASALVPQYPCGHEVKIGPWGSGGKWVCLRHRQLRNRVAVSIGKRNQAFEVDVHRQMQLTTVGFNLGSVAGEHGTARRTRGALFSKPRKLMNNVDSPSQGFLHSLKGYSIDILEVECDSCADVIIRELEATQVPVGQVLLSLSIGRDDSARAAQVVGSLGALGFRLFHSESAPTGARDAVHWSTSLSFIHQSLVEP